jgi:uridine kinase
MIFKSIRGEFKSFEQLLMALENLPRKQSTLLVGVDGCGGSGKSTFTKQLAELSSDITIIHMDDFYISSAKRIKGTAIEKPIGADVDWRRFKEQVLDPLANNENSKYQMYDWASDMLGDWNVVCIGGIVVVEGVYSIRKELENHYDYKVFVDCLGGIRLARGIERDGETLRDMWEKNWMVQEDKYMKEHKPYEQADLVIDGCGDI